MAEMIKDQMLEDEMAKDKMGEDEVDINPSIRYNSIGANMILYKN